MPRRLVTALLLAALLPLRAAAAPPPRPRVAVLDFSADGVPPELARGVAGSTAAELDRIGAFQVMTTDAVRSLLAFEKQRQMLGCTDPGCYADVGASLGAEWLVTGRVSRVAGASGAPPRLTLELTLAEVKRSERAGSAIETAASEGELVGRVGRAVNQLFQKVLAGRTGKLLVNSLEAGAVVRVDDQVKGTTPLGGTLEVPAGPHLLSVEKEGFVLWQRDVQIDAGQVTEVGATLVPSPDYVKAWEKRNGRIRAGAWIATGVAVVAVAGALWFQADANQAYGNETSPNTFLFDRRKLQDGITVEGVVNYRTQANQLQSQIETDQALVMASAGVAVVAAGVATWLWIAGDDPQRYARFDVAPVAAGVVPLPGGAYATLSLKF